MKARASIDQLLKHPYLRDASLCTPSPARKQPAAPIFKVKGNKENTRPSPSHEMKQTWKISTCALCDSFIPPIILEQVILTNSLLVKTFLNKKINRFHFNHNYVPVRMYIISISIDKLMQLKIGFFPNMMKSEPGKLHIECLASFAHCIVFQIQIPPLHSLVCRTEPALN